MNTASNARKSLFATALLGAITISSAQAITINIITDLPETFPSYDPMGLGLDLVAQAAADIWEQLRPGPGSYSMSIHWLDWGPEAELGIANGIDHTLRINSAYDWFIDPTPFDNSEFGSFQSLYYRDATGSQKSAWFDGPVPDMLEYAYFANAKSGGDAANKYDLLTVVLHEMGHLTGVQWIH